MGPIPFVLWRGLSVVSSKRQRKIVTKAANEHSGRNGIDVGLLHPSGSGYKKNPARNFEVPDCWSRWGDLVEAAHEFKLLRNSAEVARMKHKLLKCNPRMNPKLLKIRAVALCVFS